MYMDILEQEVEALSAEVTRLRLMVHRVTQVMEAPVPRSGKAAVHVDPTRDTSAMTQTGAPAASPCDLQATVDSYKQILPLVQLLLAQQQQQQQQLQRHQGPEPRTSRSPERTRRKKQRTRRDDHKHDKNSRSRGGRARRASSSSSSQASTSSSTTCTAASATASSAEDRAPRSTSSPIAAPAAAATAAAPPVPARQTQQPAHTPPSAPRVAAKVTTRIEVPASTVEAGSTAHVEAARPTAPQRSAVGAEPSSASVLDRLRAQRQQEATNEQSNSSDSSDVMPMPKLQSRTATVSPPASSARRKYVMNATSVSAVAPKEPSAAELEASAKTPVQDAARRQSTVLARDDGGGSSSVALTKRLEAPPQLVGSPTSSLPGSLYSGALPRGSVSNSLVPSEYGAYSYGALPSAFNSPAVSNVLDDAALRASRVSLPLSRAVPHESAASPQSSKHLPQQTSALSLTPRPAVASASSSSSDDSSDGEAAQLQSALQLTTKAAPFKAGLILGARQPISVQALTGPGAPSKAFSDARSTAYATSLPGPNPEGPRRSGVLPKTHPIASNGSSSSSSSDNAAFRPPPPRQAAPAMHHDSSFHNDSETMSSRDASRAGVVSPLPAPGDRSRSQSQDGYSFAAYSLQYSSRSKTPRQHDIGGEGSPLSQSLTPHQTPQSAPLMATPMSRRASIAAGGYYYGYDVNAASVSQPSALSH